MEAGEDDSIETGVADGSYEGTHRWCEGGTEPSSVVVSAVAAVFGVETDELPPLYGSVDADAMDALVTRGAAESEVSVRLAFTYAGCDVLVESDGTLRVTAADGENGGDGRDADDDAGETGAADGDSG